MQVYTCENLALTALMILTIRLGKTTKFYIVLVFKGIFQDIAQDEGTCPPESLRKIITP